jgi:hypothetical protein
MRSQAIFYGPWSSRSHRHMPRAGGTAPVLLGLARIVEGLSLGGECGASATYLTEMDRLGRTVCDDHHRFENGARFEGLPRFAAVNSGWPTTLGRHAD